MILLTGATGTLGRPLLSRLIASGQPVRALVREPRRLGPQRVQVSIAVGNLGDHHGIGRALHGVDTVIHLGATVRDQASGSIEEINGVATGRMVAAAERMGVRRFVFVTPIGASRYAPSRFLRAKALAASAVAAGRFESLLFESSIIYAPGDPWLTLLSRLSHLPVLPVPGDGLARFEPVWADDAADAIMSALTRASESVGVTAVEGDTRRIELCGPQALTHNEILTVVLNSFKRRRPLWHVSLATTRRLLRLQEWYLGPSALATWDEAQLMGFSAVASRGDADMEALGVSPLPIGTVLGN